MASKSARTSGWQRRPKRGAGGDRRGVRGARESREPVGGRRAPKTAPRRQQSRGTAGRGRRTGPFAKLKRGQGCAALLTVAERVGGEWDLATRILEVPLSVRDGNGRGVGGHLRRALPGVCRALGAFGHVQRAEIMAKLLEGPATYRALQHVTKMKAGPLYHHVNQLRLAGLILPKQRDLYELTRGGRNLILAAMVVGPLIRDARRRPVARGR